MVIRKVVLEKHISMPQARVEKYHKRLDAFSERIFGPQLLDSGHGGREDVLPPPPPY